MKKIIFLTLISLLCLVGCTNKIELDKTMYIKPTEFSEETNKVLSLFNNELQFFDISIDDTVKSYTFSLWLYENGSWEQTRFVYGTPGDEDYNADRFGIRITENKCELYSISDGAHVKYESDLSYTGFDDATSITRVRLDETKDIELNKEITLCIVAGSNNDIHAGFYNEMNFKDLECAGGIAITVSFSDQLSQ